MLMMNPGRLRTVGYGTTLGLLCLVGLSACWQSGRLGATLTPAPEVQPVIATPPTPGTPASAPGVVAHRPLTFWLPARFAAGSEGSGEAIVAAALEDFSARNPTTPVEVVLKAEDGPASLLNYLRSGQQVAPAILPDLLLIDAQQLWEVAELGLAQPLTTSQLAQRDDFYPFVWDAVTIDGQTYGIPYFVVPLHLVYSTANVETPPATWSELLDSNLRFAFAGAGRNGYADEWLLLQYLHAGGVWDSASTLNAETVRRLFQAIEEGRASGALPLTIMNYAAPGAVASALLAGDIELASLPASVYLGQRTSVNSLGVAALPQINDSRQTLTGVYTLVVLTKEVDRQAQALALIDALLDPPLHEAWARTVGWLPTRTAALDAWAMADADVATLQEMLGEAIALPGEPTFAEISKRLQLLLNGVMGGELTAEEAARAYQ